MANCVRCAVEDDLDHDGEDDRDGTSGGSIGSSEATVVTTGGARSRFSGILATLLAFTGVCLVCTVPALQTLMWTIGVGAAGYYIHLVGVAAVPFVLWLVWRGTRRHGHDRGYRWARAGAIVMAAHALLHVAVETVPEGAVASWMETAAMGGFVVTDWAGTGLLVLGATLNLVDMHRWRRTQAAGLRQLLAA